MVNSGSILSLVHFWCDYGATLVQFGLCVDSGAFRGIYLGILFLGYFCSKSVSGPILGQFCLWYISGAIMAQFWSNSVSVSILGHSGEFIWECCFWGISAPSRSLGQFWGNSGPIRFVCRFWGNYLGSRFLRQFWSNSVSR